MKLDTTQPGLSALFFTHQDALLKRLFERTNPYSKGLGSRELWDWVNEYLENIGHTKISRATAINGLQALAKEGILEFEQESCQGGHRRIYRVTMTPDEFEHFVRVEMQGKLNLIFKPDWWRIPQ